MELVIRIQILDEAFLFRFVLMPFSHQLQVNSWAD